MKKNKGWMGFSLIVGVLGLGYGAYAQTGTSGVQPPRLMPYQGYLENDGTPVTVANQEITFFITDGEDIDYSDVCNGTGTTTQHCLWTETDTLSVANGYFNTVLGDGTTFGSKVFGGTERYLGIRIDTTTLEGRQRLLASPFAITAETAANFNVSGALTVGGSVNAGGTVTASGVTSTGRVIGGTGVRVGTHAITSPSGGDLVVGGGVEIGDSSSTTNPADGDLYVQDDVQIGGDSTISGKMTVDGNLTVNGTFLRYADCGMAKGNDIQCMAADRSICSLAAVQLFDDTAGSDSWHGCNVYVVGSYWVLGSNSSGAECYARCIYW